MLFKFQACAGNKLGRGGRCRGPARAAYSEPPSTRKGIGRRRAPARPAVALGWSGLAVPGRGARSRSQCSPGPDRGSGNLTTDQAAGPRHESRVCRGGPPARGRRRRRQLPGSGGPAGSDKPRRRRVRTVTPVTLALEALGPGRPGRQRTPRTRLPRPGLTLGWWPGSWRRRPQSIFQLSYMAMPSCAGPRPRPRPGRC